MPRVAVVVVGPSLEGGGGAERRFFRLWRYLNRRGTTLYLIVNHALFESAVQAGLVDRDEAGGTLIVTPDASLVSSNIHIWRALRRVRPAVVHLPLAQRVLAPLYAILALDRVMVVTHSMTASYFAHPNSAAGLGTLALSRFLWRIARRIDSLYEGFVPFYARPLGIADRVSVSPCSFTDLERFDGRSEIKDGTIVFSGRLYAEKNPELFVRALEILQQRGGGLAWRAIIAGNGPLSSRVGQLLASGGLSDRVTLGVFPDVAPLLRRSSIYVSLQRTENYPSQALLEAMAAGNAVVATDVGETSRLVRPGETGRLVPADATQIADALADLIAHPADTQRLGENAAQLVRSEHTIERFASYIETLWREAAA